MYRRRRRQWVTRESWLLAVGIAHIVRTSRDEATAVRRICRHLLLWNVQVHPRELGTLPYWD